MRPALLLPLCLSPLALAKAIPDKEPVEYTPKPTKTKTCDCAKISPKPERRSEDSSRPCLTQEVVDEFIDGSTYLLTQPGKDPEQYNAIATTWLTDDFQGYSDSILMVTNRPVIKKTLDLRETLMLTSYSCVAWQIDPSICLPLCP